MSARDRDLLALRALRDGAEQGLGELLARGQARRGVGHQHLPAAEHIGVVGDGEHSPGPLLDDEHRGARQVRLTTRRPT